MSLPDLRETACPGCGAPDGYPPAGPCIDHGTGKAVADVSGITSCIDCGTPLVRSECPRCEVMDPHVSEDWYGY